MVKRKQVQDAYILSTFSLCATVCAACSLIYLRFVDADVLILFGAFVIYLAVYLFSYKSLIRARALARKISIEGSIIAPQVPQVDPLFSSVSLPASERPPRPIPYN